MALGVNGINQNVFAKGAETISGTELSKVAQGFLSARASSGSAPSSSVSSLLNNFNSYRTAQGSLDISLFGRNASENTTAIKFAAANNAGYEVEISQKTQSAVNLLNAQAAGKLINNISNHIAKIRDGQVHTNLERPDFSSTKSTFELFNPPQVFQSMNLSKDRQGTSPFYVPRNSGKKSGSTEETTVEGLNVIA